MSIPVEYRVWADSELLRERFIIWRQETNRAMCWLVPRRWPWLWLAVVAERERGARRRVVARIRRWWCGPWRRFWCGVLHGHASMLPSAEHRLFLRRLGIPVRCQRCEELYQYTPGLRWFRWRGNTEAEEARP